MSLEYKLNWDNLDEVIDSFKELKNKDPNISEEIFITYGKIIDEKENIVDIKKEIEKRYGEDLGFLLFFAIIQPLKVPDKDLHELLTRCHNSYSVKIAQKVALLKGPYHIASITISRKDLNDASKTFELIRGDSATFQLENTYDNITALIELAIMFLNDKISQDTNLSSEEINSKMLSMGKNFLDLIFEKIVKMEKGDKNDK